MEKSEIIEAIAKQTGIQKSETKLIIDTFINSVMEHVVNNERVILSKFGCFRAKRRGLKIGRNLSKNKPLIIPAHFRPTFKPSKGLRRKLKNIITAN